MGVAYQQAPPPRRPSDGDDVRGSDTSPLLRPPPPSPDSSEALVFPRPGHFLSPECPQLSSLVSARRALLSECTAPLTRVTRVAPSQDSACPLARPRARPSVRPPPLAPAPARAARAGAGRWRRFCCRPRGAIRRPPPGDPARGGGRLELVPGLSLAGLRHPRKFVPLLSAWSPAATR